MALSTDNKELQALADKYMANADGRYYVEMYVEDGFYVAAHAKHPGMEDQWIITFVTPEGGAEISCMARDSAEDEWMLGDRFTVSHDDMITYLQTLPKPLYEYDIMRGEG